MNETPERGWYAILTCHDNSNQIIGPQDTRFKIEALADLFNSELHIRTIEIFEVK